MTTYTQARDTLVAYLDAALKADNPALAVFYENTVEIDLASAPDMFLQVSIDFLAAKQVTLEAEPVRRRLGELILRVTLKEGKGTRVVTTLVDYLDEKLANKHLGGVVLKTPHPKKGPSKDGWRSHDLCVPFQFDSQ